MGDDVDAPHTKVIEISEDWRIADILEKIRSIQYLPTIYGGKATWSVAINEPIAVVTQSDSNPQLICMSDFPHQNTRGYVDFDKVHFNYHDQQDAKKVYEVLRNFKLPS